MPGVPNDIADLKVATDDLELQIKGYSGNSKDEYDWINAKLLLKQGELDQMTRQKKEITANYRKLDEECRCACDQIQGLKETIEEQSGAAEVLKGAYTCDHWEILDFSEKIIDLLSNKKACKKMIEMNRKSLQAISWENTGHQILEVFNSVTPK